MGRGQMGGGGVMGGRRRVGSGGGLSGTNRNIDMSGHPRDEAAVTVYNKSGGETKIMIKSKLTVRDSRSKNNNPAIKVYNKGELALVGGVDVTEVKKGIVVDGRGSSVMVMTGSIGVKTGGGPVIEVKNGGEVMLMKEVKVTGSGNVNGVGVLIENGGKVMLMEGVTMKNVKMGMKIKGNGNASVKGGGATIEVGQSGTGMEVEGNANVMELNINGSGGKGTGVVKMGEGTLTLTSVKLMQLETGARVTNGTLTLNGGSKIDVTRGGTGFNVSGGKVVMMGGSITVGRDGMGMNVSGGKATMVMGSITGNGSGGTTGVVINGRTANVTLEGVNISKFATGVEVSKGTLKLEGKTTIEVGAGGKGMEVGGSGTVMMGGMTTITVKGSGTGMYVTGGEVTMMEGGSLTITGSGSTGTTGVYVKGGTATVTLERVNISNVGEGVQMEAGESLTVEGGTRINFTGEYGIKLGKGVRAELTKVTIEGSGKGDGVLMTGSTGTLTMTGVNISNVERGIYMEAGESLMVEDGTRIEFTGDYGVYVGESVTSAELTGVTITGKGNTGTGIFATGGKSLTVSGVTRITGVEAGIYMEKGESLTVKGSTRITGVKVGISMKGSGELKVEDGTKIEFKGTYGVYVGGSVTSASLTGVKIEGSGKGSGTGVYAMGEKVMMKQVEISNVATGVEMSDGVMWLKETHLRDVAKGMTIEEAVVVMVEGSVEFKGEHGIYFKQGRAALKGITMTYKGDNKVKGADVVSPNFIKVEDGVVLAEKLTMTGNGKGQGVRVANGGAVWLKNTTFSNVRSGMTIERGGIMRMEGGSITFTGGHGIDVSGGQALLTGFSITRQGDTSKATATGTGVGVSNLGEVMMRDVNISQVEMGARVTSGLLVMDKGSIIFKRDYGINLVSGHAFLNGVKITGPGSGTGIELGYGQVLMKGTTFTNVDKAITVTQGDVKMEGGEITFTGEHGILLKQGGVALMGVTMTYLCFHVCFFCIVCECFVYFFLF
ncbi:right-handed parallel beta-helix repeat-containing protein [Bartonella schoenbuchensis]|uniref:right-handed parallel beta-helix repeat-containing protein n=1 Tax=Bartonella schoenbuchensis TaxID=165694 RepID=UPI0031CC93F7